MTLRLLEELKNSPKGQLLYERERDKKNLKTFLLECASPPSLSPTLLNNLTVVTEEKKKSFGLCGEEIEDVKRTEQEKAPLIEDEKIPQNEKKDLCKDEIQKERNEKETEAAISRLQTLTLSPEYTRSSQAIRAYEKKWDNIAKKSVLEKQKEFEENNQRLKVDAQKKIFVLESSQKQFAKNVTEQTEKQNDEESVEVKKRQMKLKRHHQEHAKRLDEKMQEIEEEQKRRDNEQKQRAALMKKILQEIHAFKDNFISTYNTFPFKDFLSETAKMSNQLMEQIANTADRLAIDSKPTTANIYKMKDILDQTKNVMEFFRVQVEMAEKQGQAAKQKELEKQKKEIDEKQKLLQKKIEEEKLSLLRKQQQHQTLPTTENVEVKGDEVLCVSQDALNEYTYYQGKLTEIENQIQDIATNPQFKKFKFDLQKAVNLPINAISPYSGSHLRDKLLRLHNLLSGKSVEVTGKGVSAKDHPQGVNFCKHLIAKMIVKKGEEQVSAKHESAFAIGAISTALWIECEDVGELILAYLHRNCPYIVPYYLPKLEGQSTEDYHKSQGYKYEDGVVEKQDKFLKRMSGILRLYAAILVATPHKGQNHPHPHGIDHAWMWLTRILNLEPRPDITATLIYDMLQVTGHALYREFKKQFLKLLHILLTEYIPKIKAVAASGGPVTRLESFLETCVKKNGQISAPDGYLAPNFWFT